MRYYRHEEIEQDKWDICVDNSRNGNVFCKSWYLNIIHPDWNAYIVSDNKKYIALLPLLDTTKFKFFRFHQKPALAQKLGPVIRDNFENSFQNFLNDHLLNRYVLFHYPTTDRFFAYQISKNPQAKINYTLRLKRSYTEIFNGFRRDRKYRIRQAKSQKLRINMVMDSRNLLKLYSKEVAPKLEGGINYKSIEKIKNLIDYIIEENKGVIIEAVSNKNITVSAAFFIFYKDRIIYFKSATNDQGRKNNANSLILDHVIQKYAESNLILDFEGSDNQGIADFFKSFGASKEHYYLAKYENWMASFYLKVRRYLL